MKQLVEWKEAVESWDARKVVSLYRGDAILFPTFQRGPLRGRREIAEYFLKFLASKPLVELSSNSYGQESVDNKGYNHLTAVGEYLFVEQTGRLTQARYVFIFEKGLQEQDWRIRFHLSSPVALQDPNKFSR